MPVSLTFYSIDERKPKHDEKIVYLKRSKGQFAEYFEPREDDAYYQWELVDKDGYYTGMSCSYEVGDDPPELEVGEENHWQLEGPHVNGYLMDDSYLWCSAEEYWKALDNGTSTFNKGSV